MKFSLKPNRGVHFLLGLAMTAAGLILLLSHVYVASGITSRGLHIGSLRVNTGMVLLPFAVGVVGVFLKPQRKWPWIAGGCGILLMLVTALCSVHIRVRYMSVMRWLLLLVLLFGGVTLMLQSVILERK